MAFQNKPAHSDELFSIMYDGKTIVVVDNKKPDFIIYEIKNAKLLTYHNFILYFNTSEGQTNTINVQKISSLFSRRDEDSKSVSEVMRDAFLNHVKKSMRHIKTFIEIRDAYITQKIDTLSIELKEGFDHLYREYENEKKYESFEEMINLYIRMYERVQDRFFADDAKSNEEYSSDKKYDLFIDEIDAQLAEIESMTFLKKPISMDFYEKNNNDQLFFTISRIVCPFPFRQNCVSMKSDKHLCYRFAGSSGRAGDKSEFAIMYNNMSSNVNSDHQYTEYNTCGDYFIFYTKTDYSLYGLSGLDEVYARREKDGKFCEITEDDFKKYPILMSLLSQDDKEKLKSLFAQDDKEKLKSLLAQDDIEKLKL